MSRSKTLVARASRVARAVTRCMVVTILAVGCARWRGSGAAAARPDSILVHVLNENYYAARLHALWAGGQPRSLGTIAGNGGQASVMVAWEPRALVFQVQLVTEGSVYQSHAVDASPGDSVEVRVPSNIGESGFFRRVRD